MSFRDLSEYGDTLGGKGGVGIHPAGAGISGYLSLLTGPVYAELGGKVMKPDYRPVLAHYEDIARPELGPFPSGVLWGLSWQRARSWRRGTRKEMRSTGGAGSLGKSAMARSGS